MHWEDRVEKLNRRDITILQSHHKNRKIAAYVFIIFPVVYAAFVITEFITDNYTAGWVDLLLHHRVLLPFFLGLLTVIFGFYLLRAAKLKRDIRYGKKEILYRRLIDKEVFFKRHDYNFVFHLENGMKAEVDEKNYEDFSIGDMLCLERSVPSGTLVRIRRP